MISMDKVHINAVRILPTGISERAVISNAATIADQAITSSVPTLITIVKIMMWKIPKERLLR